MNELDQLGAEAEIGEAARAFMESELGRTLLGIAEQEAEAARLQLETVDPDDKKAILKLQNQAALGRMFKQWLNELYEKGNTALEIYRHDKRRLHG